MPRLPNDEVMPGKTLKQLMEELGMPDPDDLTIDQLDMNADPAVFDRFDHFNAKYNPFGNSQLRTVFMKTKNHQHGLYFAEMIKQLFHHFEKKDGNNVYNEYRVSIYGAGPDEWGELSDWVERHDLYSHTNMWMVQVPRIYRVFKKIGKVSCFQDVLSNFWNPLFKATLRPDQHPALARLLENLSGFDSVDDESLMEDSLKNQAHISPDKWDSADSPSYAYQLYYFYANLRILNHLRVARGVNTFNLCPHCGESGNINHLATAYLCASGISHGINLRKSRSLQLLYYLDQIGIAVSPVSNNFLFLKYNENPFFKFFKRGLNVSLSSDDPLLFHITDDALMEEYSIARQVWGLSLIDMCEIARNSAVQSGFSREWKKANLGPKYASENLQEAIHPVLSDIPRIRAQFRHEQLSKEKLLIQKLGESTASTGEKKINSQTKTPAKIDPDRVAADKGELAEKRKCRHCTDTGGHEDHTKATPGGPV